MDWLNRIWSAIVYWGIGWGVSVILVIFILGLLYKGYKSTKVRNKLEKSAIIVGFIVAIILIGFFFKSVTHYAIDVDPDRMTAEEKQLNEQIKGVGE